MVKTKIMAFMAGLSCLCLAAVSCDKTEKNNSGVTEVSSVTLNETEIDLNVGDSLQLEASISPSDAVYENIDWESSDTGVATVDTSGLVIAVGEGVATVSVTVDGKSDECTVTVSAPEPLPVEVESVEVAPASLELYVGDESVLEAAVLPEDADYELLWTSSDESVAVVDENGTVTALSAGEAEIIASAGGEEGVCLVTVLERIVDPQVGDYFYSDGTWSSALNEAKTPVGIIFYIGQHDTDNTDYSSTGIASSQCRGYVVAIQDAFDGQCNWGEFFVELGNYMTDESGNYINDGGNDADIDFNGYSYTANMMDAAEANGGLSADDPAGYPAAFYVSNYTAAPSGTSGWFLPSASQLKTLKAQKEALNAKEGFTPFLEGESDYYWSSSESTYLGGAPMMYSLIVCFGEQGEFGSIFDEVKDYGSHHVRAILAF